MWRNVTRRFFDGTRFEGDGSALAVACLLGQGGAQPERAVEARVGGAVSERWRAGAGEPLGPYAGIRAMRELRVLGEVFGWIVEEGAYDARTIALTEIGEQAGLLGLQSQARAPRDRP